MIRKIWKKKCEIIWKIEENCEMIWKIWKKIVKRYGKCEKIWNIWKKSKLKM
jgi:hypothetical protein